MHDCLLLLICMPVMVVLTLTKVMIAIRIAELIYSPRCENEMIYNIYKGGDLKLSTNSQKDAKSFYDFLVERFGKLAVRRETIKV